VSARLRLGAQALSVAFVAALLALLVWKVVAEERGAEPIAVGDPAPDFTLPRLDGSGELSLASLRGQPVVLNFWASWCDPCEAEAPELEATWQRYRDRGLVVVGVNFNDLSDDAKRFARKNRMTFPLVRDRAGNTITRYRGYGVPVTYVIDRRGRLVGEPLLGPVHEGKLGERFRAYVEEALS
jgi:cytochrome c biogenesis protein CcmG, thiol:disulfide interchange protein DsbE